MKCTFSIEPLTGMSKGTYLKVNISTVWPSTTTLLSRPCTIQTWYQVLIGQISSVWLIELLLSDIMNLSWYPENVYLCVLSYDINNSNIIFFIQYISCVLAILYAIDVFHILSTYIRIEAEGKCRIYTTIRHRIQLCIHGNTKWAKWCCLV